MTLVKTTLMALNEIQHFFRHHLLRLYETERSSASIFFYNVYCQVRANNDGPPEERIYLYIQGARGNHWIIGSQ